MIQGLDIEINRTDRRKTIGVDVYPGCKVVVTAPQGMSDAAIKAHLQKKKHWIVEKLREVATLPAPRPRREFVSGESFPYLGKEYRLKILTSNVASVSLKDDRIYVAVPEGLDEDERAAVVNVAMTKWYEGEARKKFEERVSYFSKKLALEPSSVRVKDYGSRWGTCTPRGEIIFNWRLIMAPLAVLDYIVVHELCHLEIPQHGPGFWRLVASVLPKFKEAKGWLRLRRLNDGAWGLA